MSKLLETTIENILKSDKKLFLAITGGGTRAISKLTENGGASSVFLGAVIPYTQRDLIEICGSRGTKAVSQDCANAFSLAGWKAASADEIREGTAITVACTASLCKNVKERAGRVHQAYISVAEYNEKKSRVVARFNFIFSKERTRFEEEDLLADLLLCIAEKYMNGTKKLNLEKFGLGKEEWITTEEIPEDE